MSDSSSDSVAALARTVASQAETIRVQAETIARLTMAVLGEEPESLDQAQETYLDGQPRGL